MGEKLYLYLNLLSQEKNEKMRWNYDEVVFERFER